VSTASQERALSFRSIERLTQADFECWLGDYAPELGKAELLHGHVLRSPPATYRHGGCAVRLSTRLATHVERRRLGVVFDSSTGYELPTGDTLAPDLSFVSAARLRRGPRPSPAGFLRVVPNLVVEILSPSTRDRDLRTKREIYERCRVSEYWVLDPDGRRARVFALRGGALAEAPASVFAGTAIVRSRAVRGFAAVAHELFLAI
jgi:Uma2 family endonuclease